MRKNDVISEKLYFHFLGEYAYPGYSKFDRVKTMGTHEKLTSFNEILR